MVDPDSAEFKYVGDARVTDHRPTPFSSKIPGTVDIVCGMVNSRNRMGGYVGYVPYYVAIRNGTEVVTQAIDDGGRLKFATVACERLGLQ
jgi:hypothetical protein